MALTEKQISDVKDGLNSTWHAIASDIFSCSGASSMPRSHVIEAVLDANYLEMYGYQKSNDSRRESFKEFRKLEYKDQIKIAKTVFLCSRYGL